MCPAVRGRKASRPGNKGSKQGADVENKNEERAWLGILGKHEFHFKKKKKKRKEKKANKT